MLRFSKFFHELLKPEYDLWWEKQRRGTEVDFDILKLIEIMLSLEKKDYLFKLETIKEIWSNFYKRAVVKKGIVHKTWKKARLKYSTVISNTVGSFQYNDFIAFTYCNLLWLFVYMFKVLNKII